MEEGRIIYRCFKRIYNYQRFARSRLNLLPLWQNGIIRIADEDQVATQSEYSSSESDFLPAPKAKAKTKAKAKPKVKPVAKPKVKPVAKPKVKPAAKPKATPKVKPAAKPRAKAEARTLFFDKISTGRDFQGKTFVLLL